MSLFLAVNVCEAQKGEDTSRTRTYGTRIASQFDVGAVLVAAHLEVVLSFGRPQGPPPRQTETLLLRLNTARVS